MDDKYRSRRFIITLLGMVGSIGLAYYGKMDANVGLVLAAGIGSYNLKKHD